MSTFATRFARISVLAVATAGLVGGCGSIPNPFDWFGSSPAVKPVELPPITPTLATGLLWTGNIGAAKGAALTPVLVGANVYVAAEDGTEAKLDASTGGQVWRTALGSKISAGVGSDGKTTVVATLKGEVIALDEAGREKWKSLASSEVLSAPLVADNVVVVRSHDSRVFGFSAEDGKRLWVYQRANPPLTLRHAAGLAVSRASGGTVFVGFPGGRMAAINIANGNLRWEGTVALPRGSTELERVADVTSSPILLERDVCAVAFQGRIACFDQLSGTQVWSKDASSPSGMGGDARFVFYTDEKAAVLALSRATGASLWKQDKLFYRRLTAPTSSGRVAVAVDYQGVVHFFSREDGAMVGRATTDGSGSFVAPVALPNGVLVQTQNGGLFAFATQ